MPFQPAPQLLTPHNHALLLIDLEGQMAFGVNSIPIQELRANTAVVARSSRIFGVPTLITTMLKQLSGGPAFPEITNVYPTATTPYLDRYTMNTWEDEACNKAIRATGKQQIVLAGLWTGMCIVGPALSALAEGFEVYVIADACGDVTPGAHERALQRLVQAGVRALTAVQYVLELQRD